MAAQATPSTVPYSGAAGATTVNGYPIADHVSAYFGSITYTHTFTSALLDVARLTGQRNNNFQNFPIGTTPGPSKLGIGITPDLVTVPPIIDLEGQACSPDTIPLGRPTSWTTPSRSPTISAWTQGQALIKAGFSLELPGRDDLRLLPERRIRFLRAGTRASVRATTAPIS